MMRSQILSILQHNGIVTVEISYSGFDKSGDSGTPRLKKNETESVENESEILLLWMEGRSLEERLLRLCWDLLDKNYEEWRYDTGSSGLFVWHVGGDEITLHHTQHIVVDKYSELEGL